MGIRRKKIKTRLNGNKISKNPAVIILNYFRSEDSGTITRSLNHKGTWELFLATRECSEEESKNEYEGIHRIRFIYYKDWDKLIEDEKQFTSNALWYAKIEYLKTKYKQFKE